MTHPFRLQRRTQATKTQADGRFHTVSCLLAGAIGEALGAGIKFLSYDQIRDRWGAKGVTAYVRPTASGRSLTTARCRS